MEFRTKIPIQPQGPKIHYGSRILLLGSCFVENMGRQLDYYKFKTLQNPFGVLFHPRAISGFLGRVAKRTTFSRDDLFLHNERWHSFDAHSDMSGPDRETVLADLNSIIQQTHEFLQQTTHVVITLGTAWGYHHKDSGRTVANCHKVPQKNFKKELMEATADISECVKCIQLINKEANIIFTVSPIRHIKDGFVENQQSKARLISGVHEVVSSGEQILYFPSYEIMMDELRDYRFYAEDMLHPNQTAVDYIWKRFAEAYIEPGTTEVMKEVEVIRKGLCHRPFNEHSQAHQKFREQLEDRIRSLEAEHPEIQF